MRNWDRTQEKDLGQRQGVALLQGKSNSLDFFTSRRRMPLSLNRVASYQGFGMHEILFFYTGSRGVEELQYSLLRTLPIFARQPLKCVSCAVMNTNENLCIREGFTCKQRAIRDLGRVPSRFHFGGAQSCVVQGALRVFATFRARVVS